MRQHINKFSLAGLISGLLLGLAGEIPAWAASPYTISPADNQAAYAAIPTPSTPGGPSVVGVGGPPPGGSAVTGGGTGNPTGGALYYPNASGSPMPTPNLPSAPIPVPGGNTSPIGSGVYSPVYGGTAPSGAASGTITNTNTGTTTVTNTNTNMPRP